MRDSNTLVYHILRRLICRSWRIEMDEQHFNLIYYFDCSLNLKRVLIHFRFEYFENHRKKTSIYALQCIFKVSIFNLEFGEFKIYRLNYSNNPSYPYWKFDILQKTFIFESIRFILTNP